MDTQKNGIFSLESMPVDRDLIESLSARQLISAAARNCALNLIYPPKYWGLWVARLLLTLGVSLVLAGIICFFAFNWAKMTPAFKFGTIQIAILGCLTGSWFYGLQRLSGKIALLSASVLVGVFLAVFGQVYQTGADAYQLFMMWAALTLPWVFVSQFAALWVIWLIVSHLFLILFWVQVVRPEFGMEFTILLSYLVLLNGLFLAVREYLLKKGWSWLGGRWTRLALVLPVLVCAQILATIFVLDPRDATHAMMIGTLLSAAVHVGFYLIYRFKLPDMWAFSGTIFSCCLILESVISKFLAKAFPRDAAGLFFLMGVTTLLVFTVAIVKLRVVAKEMEVKHV